MDSPVDLSCARPHADSGTCESYATVQLPKMILALILASEMTQTRQDNGQGFQATQIRRWQFGV